MPGGISAEDLVNNIVDTFSDSVSNQKSKSLFGEEKSSTVSTQLNRLFGRQKSVHHVLGGGKSADVLLWRNQTISAGVLVGATIVWVLFEWLNYHFLSLICFGVGFGMLAQFLWSNGSGMLNRSSEVPRLVIPDEIFINIAKTTAVQVNRVLGLLQDISCGGNAKEFLMAVLSLFAVVVISNWCNFLTVLYIGFVAAHILPVLYEKYEDQVDGLAYNVLEQLRNHYKKLDAGVLSKIPQGKLEGKKKE